MSSKSYTEYERPIDVTRKSLTVCTVYIIYRPLSEPFQVRHPTGSYIHPKSGSIKEMAQDRRIVTTHH